MGRKTNRETVRTLGHGIFFHFTLLNPENNMTYGGLHETLAEAQTVKAGLIQTAQSADYGFGAKTGAKERAMSYWESFQPIELREGDHFRPWGLLETEYTHGVNDGTHGSKRPTSSIARDLLGV